MFDDFSKIVCITDRKICTVPFLEQLEKICRLKPQALILREKDLTADEYLTFAKQVQPICERHGVQLIVHSYWQAALSLGITAVHLPLPVLRSLPISKRKHFKQIGTSVHSAEEAQEAIRLGAGYLMAGNVFATSCKPGAAPKGLAFLQKICARSPVPVYAVGGIGLNRAQIENVLACGAAGVCLRSALMRL